MKLQERGHSKSKILITVLVVVVFHAVTLMLSKVVQFDYETEVLDHLRGHYEEQFEFVDRLQVLLSAMIFVSAGYWGARPRGFFFGMLLGIVAGLASAFGWIISIRFQPFGPMAGSSISHIIQACFIASLILGSMGAGVCKLFGQTK